MQFFVRSARLWLVAACALGLVASPVAAQAIPGGEGWAPGANATGDNTYNGFIDNPAPGASISPGASFRVSGWIVDTAAEGWAGIDDVQVLNGGTVLGHASVGISRPDVAAATGNPYWANSGFDATVASTGLPAGAVSLTIAAHTPGKGTWTKQVGINVGAGGGVTTSPATGLVLTIIFPTPSDEILANNNGTIRGVAYDTRTRAELGVGVDRVMVDLDGPHGTAGSQPLGVAVQTANTWALDWQPTKYDHVKHHVLWVYAHSSVTGEERLLQQEVTLD
jgi:hypothetical protein